MTTTTTLTIRLFCRFENRFTFERSKTRPKIGGLSTSSFLDVRKKAAGFGRPRRKGKTTTTNGMVDRSCAAFSGRRDDDDDDDDAKETKRLYDDDFDDANDKNMQRRRMTLIMVASNVAGVLLASGAVQHGEEAKAFTVGGDNLSGTMFPSSNEAFVMDDGDVQREQEEPYTTKDLVVDFVSPILALRLVNIGFNGGMGGSPKWLDYLVVAGVGVVIFVFATDNTALDAALH